MKLALSLSLVLVAQLAVASNPAALKCSDASGGLTYLRTFF
jgi:hypothetical protein